MGSKNGARRVSRKMAMGVAAGGSAAAVLGGTLAFGSIPNGNTFNACRAKTNGALRLIDKPKQKCTSKEAAVSWSKTGPKGDTGAPGPSGVLSSVSTSHAADSVMSSLFWLDSGSPSVTVTTGQTVKVDASAVLGSTPGVNDLSLQICYDTFPMDSSFTPIPVGMAESGLTIGANSNGEFTLNGLITGLAPGTYKVGLCASSSGSVNSGGTVATTAMTF